MYYIVLLGNPGDEYVNTRHNVAWYLADKNFCTTLQLDKSEINHHLKAKLAVGCAGDKSATVVWPQTFMNRSGETVEKLVSDDGGHRLIVVHDDVDLPLGQVRVGFDRGDGGHNGLKSIIKTLGTQAFVRVRIGIGPTSFLTGKMLPRPSGDALSKYVLGNLSLRDKHTLKSVAKILPDIITTIVNEGHQVAMNQFN